MALKMGEYHDYCNWITEEYKNTNIVKFEKIDELKKREKILLCGNGESLLGTLKAIKNLDDYDVCGTGSIHALNIKKNLIFYEAIPTLENELTSNREETIGGKLNCALYFLIASAITTNLNKDESEINIILNPQLCMKKGGVNKFINPYAGNKSCKLMPYYFINEASNMDAIKDLKTYQLNKIPALLNYSCSIVRMLSYAYAAGYEHIEITGLDPTKAGYWYTSEEYLCSELSGTVDPQLKNLFQINKDINRSHFSRRSKHEGEINKIGMTMNATIWFAIKTLDKWALARGKITPKITYRGNDVKVLEFIGSYAKRDRVNVKEK